MPQKKKETMKLVIGLAILAVLVGLLGAAYAVFGPKPVKGAKTITIEVVDNEKSSTVYTVNTDAEYLRQAMEEAEGLEFSGTESEYGLMLETVNGLRAVYSEDGAYWSIMVNGEYGMYGMDSQPVADKDAYQIVYTAANEE